MGETGIKPALTPEEWDSVQNYGLSNPLECENYPHAKAALALHEQPFGFTWAHVDTIHGAARHIERISGSSGGVAGLLAVADRIAALLPPRTAER